MLTSMTCPNSRPGRWPIDDMEREDDELAGFHALVRHLVIDGDQRAAAAGRRARRTRTQMAFTGQKG
ncbi:hypothetical protein [Streptomyces sp. NBC_00470]|uniref:hypothetical protein n=1 Tax=Streptomyces sp. NBC_00470 TaxID=2975753 RepID=UPI0030E2956A